MSNEIPKTDIATDANNADVVVPMTDSDAAVVNDDAGAEQQANEVNPAADIATYREDNDEIEEMEDIEDDIEDDIDDDNEDDDDAASNNNDNNDDSASDPSTLLIQAITLKEEGNTFFQSGNLASATRSYRKGTTLLKPLHRQNSSDDQIKSLLLSLQTNLSTACYKQQKHKLSRDVASNALRVDPTHVKALYRRAVASRAMGDVAAAKTDLREAHRLDPKNGAVKKELASVRKVLDDAKRLEKERLKKAFSKSSSILYQDKEEEDLKKERERKEKEAAEMEALKKRKQEWEDECVTRMAREEEAVSFEEWEKERKKNEEEEEETKRKKARKEEEERKQLRAQKERERNGNKNNTANSGGNSSNTAGESDDDDDDELTESELKMLRGYKKTSDGRTTSYFNREQTDHEKQLIGCIAPKRLDSSASANYHDAGASSSSPATTTSLDNNASTNNGSPFPSPTGGVTSSTTVGSAWNKSGTTWEEKDTTEWCKKCLTDCLKNATAAYTSCGSTDSSTYIAVVKKIKDLTGDASVALAGGKKRYIYDFHAKLNYDILDEGDDVIASGSLKLPDINSATTCEEELEVDVFAWKKAPGANAQSDVVECRGMLVQDVRKSVLRFVEQFNANF